MKKSLFIILLFIGIPLSAQKAAVKTNLLYDATTTLNLGVEFGLSPKWTLDLSANYNPFSISETKKWRHWMAQPELRYWFCERLNAHFMGLHLLGGEFNVGDTKFPFGMYPSTKGYRYQGEYYGGGLAYGYQWVLGNHWNLEASIGVGFVHANYDKYECPKCGDWIEKGTSNFIGVTKAALSFVYIIK